MSTAQLKSKITTTTGAPTTLAHLLAKDNFKAQIAMALPKHMTVDRMVRIATTELRRVPKLAQCDQVSFFSAIMQCAQIGLEPGGSLGHAYLIPFFNKKKQQTECQLIIGYRGMLDIARRSGQIISISARIVREGDDFSYSYGLHEDVRHIPGETGQQGAITHVYAVARLKGDGVQFEVLNRAEIEKVRAQSQSSGSGPWATHFEEMAKKTAIRRIFKYLPISIEMQQAVSVDERADQGLGMDTDLILNDYEVLNTDTGEIIEPQAEDAKVEA